MKPKKQADIIREQPMTYDDYAAMPDDEFAKYELVDGNLELLPAAGTKHQAMSAQLFMTLTNTCKNDYVILQDVDVIFSQRNFRRPDLVMIHKSRIDIVTKRGVESPPDLVVEILSPSSVRRDKIGKVETYARFGVPEYWIVDQANELLEQYVLNGDRFTLHDVYTGEEPVRSDKLPCVSFTMKELMDGMPYLPNA